jgi:predicted O-methyltransferase YrrM
MSKFPATNNLMDDARIKSVLEAYDERVAQERQVRRDDPGAMQSPGWRDTQLLTVGEEVGQLLNMIGRSLNKPSILEIGTSYGYSGIWLAEAARATGGRLTTLELQDYKSAYARDMAEKAGLADHVDFLVGDAVDLIEGMSGGFDLILLDLWKDMYVPCLEAFYPKLNPGAIIVADNMLFPGGEAVAAYGRAVRAKPDMTSVLLPVGQGIEISRYEPG